MERSTRTSSGGSPLGAVERRHAGQHWPQRHLAALLARHSCPHKTLNGGRAANYPKRKEVYAMLSPPYVVAVARS